MIKEGKGSSKHINELKYYRVLSDLQVQERCFLGPVKCDLEDISDDIREGKKIPTGNMHLEVQNIGNPLDFTFAAFDVPIISARILEIFDINDVELLPVKIKGVDRTDFYILKTKKYLDAIDREASEYTIWNEKDNFRKDLIGKFKSFSKIKVITSLSGKDKVFRVKDYSVILVVNEEIYNRCIEMKVSGIVFKEV